MNARFLHSSTRNGDNPAMLPPDDSVQAGKALAGLAGRACCCPARPMVSVVMPPTSGRPHRTELLLCGHHYRVSRQTLAAAHARVGELPGTPREIAAWIRLDRYSSPAQVG